MKSFLNIVQATVILIGFVTLMGCAVAGFLAPIFLVANLILC